MSNKRVTDEEMSQFVDQELKGIIDWAKTLGPEKHVYHFKCVFENERGKEYNVKYPIRAGSQAKAWIILLAAIGSDLSDMKDAILVKVE